MQACDPLPGAPNTCPGGYHCTPDGHCDAQCTLSGTECGDGFHCTNDGQCQEDGACEGIQCDIVKCESMGMPATTLTGKVFAPNGTLPLYGVNVYVPLHAVGALPDGAVCSKCADTPLGDPLVSDITKEDGSFTLNDVPSGSAIPLVIVSGKWRRVITIPTVNQCTDNPVGATDTTFPKSMDDMTPNTMSVSMPKIAITDGSADNLECLIRKMGVADKEITLPTGAGKVNIYHGNGKTQTKTGFAGGGQYTFPDAGTLWSDTDKMKGYDAVILSCEGAQNPNTKPQAAMDAVKAYADFGGRLFASHWHNIWIEGSTEGGGNQKPAVWPTIATWDNGHGQDGTDFSGTDTIDETNNPKGAAFATWMTNVGGSPTRDIIPITGGTGKITATNVDVAKAEKWVFRTDPHNQVQNFQFTTPNEALEGDRCGKVVFSDMHVSGGPMQGDYPDSCGGSLDLSSQEKALAFMLFDLSSCVGSIF